MRPAQIGWKLVRLVETSGNPVPRNATCGTLRTRDGVTLRFARWPSARPPVRGTVIVLQGRGEFIEKYFETVNDLRRRNFAVLAFDWRGQGGSDRLLDNPRKGHVPDFGDYVTDFESVMQEVALADCPPPFYVLGHSTGGAVALLASYRMRTQIERIVLTAPLIGLSGVNQTWLERLTSLLIYFGAGESFAPGKGATLLYTEPHNARSVTSDAARYKRAMEVIEAGPELGIGGPTVSWVHAALRASRYFTGPDFPDSVPVPVLMALAGAETVVSNAAAERLSLRVKTIAHVRISGARHEILMERDVFRDQFWAAFDAFVRGR